MGHRVGFVPTMGALHQGHVSLIQRAKAETSLVMCSIFVNPTQFNDPEDLKKYPRNTAWDVKLLTTAGCDVLFLPSTQEIYPPGLKTGLSLDFGSLEEVMEGIFRPGHFDGVAQVVKRLLDIVQPHRLYMGQKDYQQFTIVASMLEQLDSDIELVMCPIVREADGLAMSSRNVRLQPQYRKVAPKIYQTLQWARETAKKALPAQIRKEAVDRLNGPGLKVEYFEIVDGQTLQPIEQFADAETVVACTAVWAGEVRLIDNIIIKN